MANTPQKRRRKEQVKIIERYLRQYKSYVIGRTNLQRQLANLLPEGYATEDEQGSAPTLDQTATAVACAEDTRAAAILEKMKHYDLIISSISDAVSELNEIEYNFVKRRYFDGELMMKVAIELGYEKSYLYEIKTQIFDQLLISLNNLLEM